MTRLWLFKNKTAYASAHVIGWPIRRVVFELSDGDGQVVKLLFPILEQFASSRSALKRISKAAAAAEAMLEEAQGAEEEGCRPTRS